MKVFTGAPKLRHTLIVSLVVVISLVASYSTAAAWRRHKSSQPAETPFPAQGFPSGDHLVAYVLMSSKCHYCTSEPMKAAFARLRPTLRKAAAGRFAAVSVVAVALDPDLTSELGYVRDLGDTKDVFDELSIGGSWMNQNVTSLVWRDGFGLPAVPQVILVSRRVDAANYPQHIDVQPENLLYRAIGNDVISWIDKGAPVPTDTTSSRPAAN